MRNMNENTIQTFRTSSRTAECDVVVLKETSSTRLVFRPQIVDNPSNPEACVNGHLFHQKKTRSGLWEDAESLNLSTLKSGEGVRITLHSAELMLLKEAQRASKGQHCLVRGGPNVGFWKLGSPQNEKIRNHVHCQRFFR